jgi:hypothetical protein
MPPPIDRAILVWTWETKGWIVAEHARPPLVGQDRGEWRVRGGIRRIKADDIKAWEELPPTPNGAA